MNDLLEFLKLPNVTRPQAVHEYDCPNWRNGKHHGPCTCGAAEIDARLRAALISNGVEVWESPNEVAERAALSASGD